eukprot:SAG31_NODE_44717_length_261_cov_1.555556_1_plen_40_part_01
MTARCSPSAKFRYFTVGAGPGGEYVLKMLSSLKSIIFEPQ